ncbi:hypothetical protein PspLS_03667 [Pyricularia sp. CBS 133598]|nr:hypothetical protein PspLS_03667 [Pyricularia sp. CBS 133598]
MKSHKEEDVLRAMETNIWTTSFHNGKALIDAYRNTKHTLALIASATIQGMELTSKKGHQPGRRSGQFSIQWLCKSPLPFRDTKHVRNVLDHLKPVLFGQELDYYCGRDLLKLVDNNERELQRRY